MNDVVVFFAVVDRNRKVHPHLYKTRERAERYARAEGDSVVEVFVDFGKAPLFIRGRVL